MISREEAQEWGRKMRAEKAEFEKQQMEIRRNELIKQGINPDTHKPIRDKQQHEYDHPCMPDNGFVTVLYILGMIGSLIFTQWYIAWFALTVWYGMYITRHDND